MEVQYYRLPEQKVIAVHLGDNWFLILRVLGNKKLSQDSLKCQITIIPITVNSSIKVYKKNIQDRRLLTSVLTYHAMTHDYTSSLKYFDSEAFKKLKDRLR